MFESKITKEDLNLLPPVDFDGEITVIDNLSKLNFAIEELQKQSEIGFDTETKPTFKKGDRNKVSLLQLSTDKHCFLFRINKIGLPPPLIQTLTEKKIKKIGLSMRDDISGLNGHQELKIESAIDLQEIVGNYGISELSLQKIYALIFNKKISKSQQLSNWEKDELSEKQQLYAAIDAWACLKIFRKLKEHDPSGIKKRAEKKKKKTPRLLLKKKDGEL